MQTWENLKKNPQFFERYFVKEYLLAAIRKYFSERKYHELEVPILTNALPQERYLDVLTTNIALQNGTIHQAYLIPTTETFNKKILAAGLGNHFVISKVFRALEEISTNHSPEFTMLEWYTLGKDYFFLMKQTQDLLRKIIKETFKKLKKKYNGKLFYQGQEVDLQSEFYRFSVPDLVKKYLGVSLDKIQTVEAFRTELMKFISVSESSDWQTVFELFMANLVEPELKWDRPVFIYNFPKILCPLVKPNKKNHLVSEKVELYIAGKEVANGYSELTDWKLQEANFLVEEQARKELGKSPVAFDHELVKALKAGMPEVAGIGMGIDRLAMMVANATTISEINYFPASEAFEEEGKK
ncbi:MAG: amino acid--tRNA ligase-related protein [bacterium]